MCLPAGSYGKASGGSPMGQSGLRAGKRGEKRRRRWEVMPSPLLLEESGRPLGAGDTWGMGGGGVGMNSQAAKSILSGGFSGIYGLSGWLECRCELLSDFGLCCRPQAGETFWNVPLAFQSHLWPHLLFTLLFLPLCSAWQPEPVPVNCWSKVRSPRTWRNNRPSLALFTSLVCCLKISSRPFSLPVSLFP